MNDGTADILLVGIGGGGCRFASAAARRFGPGIHAVGFDTDAATSRSTSGMRCLLLGASRLDGQGTGGDSVKGRAAADDSAEVIAPAISSARMAVVVAALGGGVGTGATPVVLSALRSRGVPTLCVATLPFEFEGRERTAAATRALPVLEEVADALVALRLDDLYGDVAGSPLSEAMVAAEERLGDALSLLWSLVLTPGYISLGPAFLASLLSQSSGRCRFAVASAEGEGRAAEAVGLLCRSPMLGASHSLEGVQAVLLGVLAGSDLRLKELSDISGCLRGALPQSCSFNISTVLDERYAGTVRLIALFFDSIRPDSPPAAEGIEEFKAPAAHKTRRRGRGGDGRLAPGERDRFQGIEGTFIDGENLDIPTYQRLRIRLDR